MVNFINPYNFVPLAQKEPSRRTSSEKEKAERYTGKIQYKIKTLSPLFIPNTSNDRGLGVKGEDDIDEKYHKSYDFFSYQDLSGNPTPDKFYEPVIPGSELRGMMRSVYETMTNSCLSAVDENVKLSKRTQEYFKPGILLKKGNTYELYEAKDYLYRKNGREDFSLHHFEDKSLPADGSHIYFSVDKNSVSNRPKYAKPFAYDIKIFSPENDHRQKDGYLIKGEAGPKLAKSGEQKCGQCPKKTQEKCGKNEGRNCYLLEKHCAHVFEIIKKDKDGCDKEPIRFTEQSAKDDLKQRMDNLLKIYKLNNDEKDVYREYRDTWNRFTKAKEDTGIAVYYSVIDGTDICYLSPACITREVYRNTLGDILGGYCSCDGKNGACPACRLFGTVNGKLRIASGLRFSDAYISGSGKKEDRKDYYDAPLTLPELSAPKLSSAEFYLRRPNEKAVSWTYDYYVERRNGENIVKEYSSEMPQISGRKFYWHSPETAEWIREVQDTIHKIQRNKTIRPVRKGIEFQGELYFDKITKDQLEDMIRILDISKLDDEGKYGLKLGSAKPLGFGSVAMEIEKVVIRKVAFNEEEELVYKEEDYQPYVEGKVGLTDEIRKTGILKILDVNALKNGELRELQGRVHYPCTQNPYLEKRGEKAEEGFVWFAGNRDGKPRTRLIRYKEYMEPLKPQLAKSDARNSKIFSASKDERQPGYEKNAYIKGKEYSGIVIGLKDGKFVQVRLDEGGVASIPHFKIENCDNTANIEDALPIGTNVSVTYGGKYQAKNDRWYDSWSCKKL